MTTEELFTSVDLAIGNALQAGVMATSKVRIASTLQIATLITTAIRVPKHVKRPCYQVQHAPQMTNAIWGTLVNLIAPRQLLENALSIFPSLLRLVSYPHTQECPRR